MKLCVYTREVHISVCVHAHLIVHVLWANGVHVLASIYICTHTCTRAHLVDAYTHIHTHTNTGLTSKSVSLNGTFEISHNVFQENEAGELGAAVVLPLCTAFTLRTQTVTVFQNK